MPPSMSRSSLSTLSRCRCPNSSIPLRSFSTTQSCSAIGPENPRFIEVPTPLQPRALPKIDIKGNLPPPRNIFPKRAGDKTSPEYLARVTKEPEKEYKQGTPLVEWKRRMAERRRTNLREGIIELHERKVEREAAVAGRSRARSIAREKRLHAPQREDERLTNPTITKLNSTLQSGQLPDPNREERIAEMAARVQAIEARKKEARQEALHTMYMHARTFITTEEQLDQRIDEIFTETPFNPNDLRDNIWDVAGHPQTVSQMLSEHNGSYGARAMDFHAGPSALIGKRMKRIAEELTGGKMD